MSTGKRKSGGGERIVDRIDLLVAIVARVTLHLVEVTPGIDDKKTLVTVIDQCSL